MALMMSVSSCPARPTNGSPLQILIVSRRLADEHQIRVRIADAEDDVRARTGEPACGAVVGLGARKASRSESLTSRRSAVGGRQWKKH